MEKEVIISRRFRKNIISIHKYLLEEFSVAIANEFFAKLEKRIEFIILHPSAGRPSAKRASIRSHLFTPNNQIFYRQNKNKIELLCLSDMRKNLSKKPY